MGVSMRNVEWLRASGHDVINLHDEKLQKLPNGEIFQKAIGERRIVLTFDLDFGEIAAAGAPRSLPEPRDCSLAALQRIRSTTLRQAEGVVKQY